MLYVNRTQSHHHLYDFNEESSMATGSTSVQRNPSAFARKTSGNANLANAPAHLVSGVWAVKT